MILAPPHRLKKKQTSKIFSMRIKEGIGSISHELTNELNVIFTKKEQLAEDSMLIKVPLANRLIYTYRLNIL